MENSLLLTLFYVATLLFFAFEASMYLSNLFVFLKDKSFKNKTVNKIMILKSWFFVLFIGAFFFTMYLLKTSKVTFITNIVFLVGFGFMLILRILSKKIVKNKRFITDTLGSKIDQNILEETFQDNAKVFNSNNEISIWNNSITNDEINTVDKKQLNINASKSSEVIEGKKDDIEKITIIPSPIVKEDLVLESFKDFASGASEPNDICSDVKLEDSNKKNKGRVTKQIYYKGTNVMPLPIPDEIIEQKLKSIQKHYLLYCNTDDFKKLLKKIEIVNKVLFRKEDETIADFSKVNYLRFLYFILDDNLIEHPSNKKIIEWIEKNFDSKNIGETTISTKEISDLRTYVKNKNSGI